MKLEAALSGDLKRMMEAELRAARTAITQSIEAASAGLQADLRADTEAALGRRVAQAWRRKRYPQGRDSMAAAGWVYTKAPKIVAAFSQAQVIRAASGFWLAIPGPGCPSRIGRKRPTPALVEEYYKRPLQFVYRPGKPALLVMDFAASIARKTGQFRGWRNLTANRQAQGRGGASAIMFVLVPQIRTRKRFDIDARIARWEAKLPGLMVENWEQLAKRDFIRLGGA